LTKQHHDHLCEWTCLPICWWGAIYSKSAFIFYRYFYVLKFISQLPKQHLSWLWDSILQCDAIWILNLLPGLASKGVGRSMDMVNFFTAILLQCPFFRERKPTPGRIIYAPAARHRHLFISGQRRRNRHYPFRRDKIPPDSSKFLQNHKMSPSSRATTLVHSKKS